MKNSLKEMLEHCQKLGFTHYEDRGIIPTPIEEVLSWQEGISMNKDWDYFLRNNDGKVAEIGRECGNERQHIGEVMKK